MSIQLPTQLKACNYNAGLLWKQDKNKLNISSSIMRVGKIKNEKLQMCISKFMLHLLVQT